MKKSCCQIGVRMGLVIVAVPFLLGCPAVECGDGSGSPIEFCRLVDGLGQSTEDDFVLVDCLVGPFGATVNSNSNGNYFVAGTYSSSAPGRIRLSFGGTSLHRNKQDFTIAEAGRGSFTLSTNKIEGGRGNMFLSLVHGNQLVVDRVFVNVECDTADASISLKDDTEVHGETFEVGDGEQLTIAPIYAH